jgi:hypothetical protein
MTSVDPLERALSAWLDGQAAALPPPGLHATAMAQVRRRRQRPGWWASVRASAHGTWGLRPALVGAGVALASLAVVVIGLRAGLGPVAMPGGAGASPSMPPTGEVGPARWWLDPDVPEPGPDATELHVLALEQACASGSSPEGRIMPPEVTMDATHVTVTIGVRRVEGFADCPSNPAWPMTVTLPEPLGDRQLLDGSVQPPSPPQPPEYQVRHATPRPSDPARAAADRLCLDRVRADADGALDDVEPIEDSRVAGTAWAWIGVGQLAHCVVMPEGSAGFRTSGVVLTAESAGTPGELDLGIRFGWPRPTLALGTLGPGATAVHLALSDGDELTATVSGGHWLAWWPSDATISRLSAVDAVGAIVDELEGSKLH